MQQPVPSSSDLDMSDILLWQVATPQSWYTDRSLTAFVQNQLDPTSYGEANMVDLLSHAIRNICHFRRPTKSNGAFIQLRRELDLFRDLLDVQTGPEKRRLHQIMTDRVSLDAGGGEGDETATVSSSALTASSARTGARLADWSLGVHSLAKDKGLTIKLVMEAKSGKESDVPRLARKGFFQCGWYLLVAHRTYGCRLACLFVNNQLQRFAILDDGTLAVELSDRYDTAGPVTIAEFLLTDPFDHTLPSSFPAPVRVGQDYQLEYIPGRKTAVEYTHEIYRAAVQACANYMVRECRDGHAGSTPSVPVTPEQPPPELLHPVAFSLTGGVSGTEGDLYAGTENCENRVRGRKAKAKKRKSDGMSGPSGDSKRSAGGGGGGESGSKGDKGDGSGNGADRGGEGSRGSGNAGASSSSRNGASRGPHTNGPTSQPSSRQHAPSTESKSSKSSEAGLVVATDSGFQPGPANQQPPFSHSSPPEIALDFPEDPEEMDQWKSEYLAERGLRESRIMIRVVTTEEMSLLVARVYGV